MRIISRTLKKEDKNMIYNKYNNDTINCILLKIKSKNHEFLKKQASMHDISLTFLINKILDTYIKKCKENIKNM